jgi:hypothetical protein
MAAGEGTGRAGRPPLVRERIVAWRSCRPHKGAGCGAHRSEKREMAAGKVTGKAGKPPQIGNRVPLVA